MATTSSSQASSLAPTDFKITTSLEESHGAISVAVEKCQLCGISRRPFYCKNCVQSGDFSHSKGKGSERYSEKLHRWHMLKKERLKLLHRVEEDVHTKYANEEKLVSMHQGKQCIQLLQDAIQEAANLRDKDRENVLNLREKNEKRKTKSHRHAEKKRRIYNYIEQIRERTRRHREDFESHRGDLYALRQQHVKHLLEYIFTLKDIEPKSESDMMVMSTVSALAEARRTSYVRGRWVYTDNGGEHQYMIVEPSLPGNGDYSGYHIWLLENKEAVQGQDWEYSKRNPAYTMSAGLSYSTQLITLLAYFLDINLPKKLCYSEFCGNELTEHQFQRSVARLNQNVLHLCFTQNVDSELLNPRHTLHNLLTLVQSQDLGRSGSFEVSDSLMQSLEESQQSDSSDYDASTTDDETEVPEREWEHVPVTIPELDIPTSSMETYMSVQIQSGMPSGGMQTTTTTVNTTGGLMSSAAASMASFWRAATGQK